MKIDISALPIKYINMEKDTDKNASMLALGESLELANYSRSPGFYTPGRPNEGCAKSHYEILKDVKEPTVILEDDCVIRHKELVFEVPDDADAVYLGLSSFGRLNNETLYNNYTRRQLTVYPKISKINGMLATHAILYLTEEYISTSKRVAKWSAEMSEHIDNELSRVHRYYNIYALNDPIFYQNSNAWCTDFAFDGAWVEK